jgi:hypothetical protein
MAILRNTCLSSFKYNGRNNNIDYYMYDVELIIVFVQTIAPLALSK